MKINSVSDNILGKVVEDIERRYPLLDGTDNGWPKSLFKSREDLMNPENNRYPLMREPIIECIPKYLRDGTGWVSKLYEDGDLSSEEANEMKEIVETLESTGPLHAGLALGKQAGSMSANVAYNLQNGFIEVRSALLRR